MNQWVSMPHRWNAWLRHYCIPSGHDLWPLTLKNLPVQCALIRRIVLPSFVAILPPLSKEIPRHEKQVWKWTDCDGPIVGPFVGSSAVAEIPRCRVCQFWPNYKWKSFGYFGHCWSPNWMDSLSRRCLSLMYSFLVTSANIVISHC